MIIEDTHLNHNQQETETIVTENTRDEMKTNTKVHKVLHYSYFVYICNIEIKK